MKCAKCRDPVRDLPPTLSLTLPVSSGYGTLTSPFAATSLFNLYKPANVFDIEEAKLIRQLKMQMRLKDRQLVNENKILSTLRSASSLNQLNSTLA
jgi:hypothetical protein